MTIETVKGTSLKYYLIAFDADGCERRDDSDGLMSQRVVATIEHEPATDVFILCHGWKGDVPAARAQYHKWIAAMAQCEDDIQTMRAKHSDFHPLLIGLHWPSQPWGDEELDSAVGTSFAVEAAAPIDRLVEEYSQRIADTPKAREALRTIFEAAKNSINPVQLPPNVREAYRALDQESGMGSRGEGAAPGDDREPFDPDDAYGAALEEEELSFGKLSLGGLLSPLRQLSFWKMKDRARKFGESSAHDFLTRLQQQTPPPRQVRFHLMGHSFGCLVVSSMIAGESGHVELTRPIDSVALAQGALSIWSYCPEIPFPPPGRPGYFNSIVSGHKVRGPLITTLSKFDTAVGRFYPIGAGARGDVAFETQLPKYGGLGAYGVRGLESIVVDQKMLCADAEYRFERGKIYNLESSDYISQCEGVSGAHSDITKREVAHAVWGAALAAA